MKVIVHIIVNKILEFVLKFSLICYIFVYLSDDLRFAMCLLIALYHMLIAQYHMLIALYHMLIALFHISQSMKYGKRFELNQRA